MKRSYIWLIAIVAVAVGIIISTTSDASKYVEFKEAFMDRTTEYHVVGELPKRNGTVQGLNYDPRIDPNYFTFYLKDQKGDVREVVYLHPKPADFERSEKIVIVGRAEGEAFLASKILMKCPSKYQESELKAGL